jgi:predicted metal-dependent peptidase
MLPEVITKARERLLVRARFFGSIALWLDWVEAPEVGTMATDGRHVWFCRQWCEAQGVRKTMGVIAHEVLHVVDKHHLRRGERDPERWNIAADLLINRLLTEDAYELPEDGQFDREQRFAGLPVEAVYRRLEQEQEHLRQPPDEANQQTQQGGAGTSRTNATNTNAGSSTLVHDKGTPRILDSDRGKVAAAKRWGEVRDLTGKSGKPLNPSELRQAENHLDVVIRQAVAAAKRAGQYSSTLCETIEASLDRVDWRDRLRTLFDGTIRNDASWSRPNRRFVQHGIFLPGWQRTGAGRVAFVLDTSGSISVLELALYTGNLLGVIEETGPQEIIVIQCDAEVRRVDYLGPGETFDRIEVEGRGGTRLQPAFDWIAQNAADVNIIIYATDLICSDTPENPGLPVIWLTPTRGKSMPFGEIIHVKP